MANPKSHSFAISSPRACTTIIICTHFVANGRPTHSFYYHPTTHGLRYNKPCPNIAANGRPTHSFHFHSTTHNYLGHPVHGPHISPNYHRSFRSQAAPLHCKS